ncbi:MAG: CRTAC1 family protein, partial [Bacteroidota bacterium]|nr:CRTAC1 family protein [Bacteroidota bacterium]
MSVNRIAFSFLVIATLLFSCIHKQDSNSEMVERLQQQDKFETNSSNIYSCAAVLAHLDSLIASAPNGAGRLQFNIDKANTLLQLGRERQAVRILDSLNKTFIPDYLNRQTVVKTLALAYLRLGERTNCIINHTAESCLFPIQGSGV